MGQRVLLEFEFVSLHELSKKDINKYLFVKEPHVLDTYINLPIQDRIIFLDNYIKQNVDVLVCKKNITMTLEDITELSIEEDNENNSELLNLI